MKLKIDLEFTQELTKKGIVICTYLDLEGNDVNCIDISYKNQYPTFTEVEVQESEIF